MQKDSARMDKLEEGKSFAQFTRVQSYSCTVVCTYFLLVSQGFLDYFKPCTILFDYSQRTKSLQQSCM